MARRPRQSLTFTGAAAELVERLARERGVSVAEVVREALAREQWFTEATRKGRILYQEHGKSEPHEVQFVRI
jgi:Ribbon-helix-helix protein, copG family